MVVFFLGFSTGIISAFTIAVVWGYQLSVKEDELNKELIKDFQDKMIESQQEKNYKRYES